MKKRMRACLLALAVSWLAGNVHAAAAPEDPAIVAAAQKEGEVVWYTTLIVDQAVRPLVAAFEKKYPGIKVRPVRSQGPETTLQLLQEARAGNIQADVMDAVLSGVIAIPDDLMLPAPTSMTSVVAPANRLPGDRWVQIAQYFSCIAINTDLVKDSDAPKTLEDLLDPKWKGKMVWHSTPDLTGPPGFIGLVLTQMGQEKGMAYLRKLAAQKITMLPSSQRGVMDQMISGAYSIQLMAVTHHAVISAKQGAPVRWLKIDPLIATGSYIGLIGKVHHPNAARLLADFVLSDEGQTVLRQASYIPASTHVDALEPTLKPGPGNFKAWVMTPDIARKDLPGWVAIYKQLFQ